MSFGNQLDYIGSTIQIYALPKLRLEIENEGKDEGEVAVDLNVTRDNETEKTGQETKLEIRICITVKYQMTGGNGEYTEQSKIGV